MIKNDVEKETCRAITRWAYCFLADTARVVGAVWSLQSR